MTTKLRPRNRRQPVRDNRRSFEPAAATLRPTDVNAGPVIAPFRGTRTEWISRIFPRADARLYQMFCQGLILCYGLKFLDFRLYAHHIPVILGACLATQFAAVQLLRRLHANEATVPLPAFDWRSPTVTGMSLILLLRTNELWLSALAAVIAISGKFLIRVNGKHIFNPSLFGIIAMLILFPGGAWVSPAQWGREGLFLFFITCAGGCVLFRALRSDITLAFLATYALLIVGRTLWLGDPWPIARNQLASGGLLIFAFFMISDPRSTPDARAGRILFSALTALIAFYIQFGLFRTNGPLWALFLCAFSVPLIDRFLFQAKRFEWNQTSRRGPEHTPAITGAGK